MTDTARAFRRAALAGGVALVIAVVLTALLPVHAGALPPGLRTPMLAFELARTPEEVESLFAAPGSAERAALVRAMDLGNLIDFAFMAAYGSFLVLFGAAAAQTQGKKLQLASVLGPLGALLDVGENIQLLAITKSLGADYAAELGRLQAFTWIKWEALAIALASLAPALFRAGGRAPKVASVLCAACAPLGVLAFFERNAFAETFALAVVLGFVSLEVVAVFSARRG